MTFNWCPPGTYEMGGTFKTEVTIANGFWMGKYEVTQEQFEKAMLENPQLRKRRFVARCKC